MIYMLVTGLLMPLMAMAQVNNAVNRDFGKEAHYGGGSGEGDIGDVQIIHILFLLFILEGRLEAAVRALA